jgi:hypothetical protein
VADDLRAKIDALNQRVDELQAKVQEITDFIDAWRARNETAASDPIEPDDAEVPDEGAPEPDDSGDEPHIEHR